MDIDEKIIIVDNPTDLPLAKLDDFILFQGDLKKPIAGDALDALKASIVSHHIFIGKAIAWFNGEMLTEDGHQTLRALKSLRNDGFSYCRVISYTKKDGNMIESASEDFDDIMLPYQIIVPQGRDYYEKKKDAAAKIAIINSRYAELNPDTTFFANLDFNAENIQTLSGQIHFPEVTFAGFDFFTNIINPQSDIKFKEYDESIAEGVEVCTCPTCGNEHTKK